MHYNILSVERISWKQNCWENIWGWENDLGLRQGSPFRATQDFSHICFVSRHNSLTGKTCFTIVEQSLFYQKCVYNVKAVFVCVCWTKQLAPPTFLQCISVKPKCHDCKVVETIITNPLQYSKSLTSDVCGDNAIWHVFQTAVLYDVNVDQRLAIGRYSSS